MANMGAVCYEAAKETLYGQWSTKLSVDDTAKAELWRAEGKQAMLELVKSRLAEVDGLTAKLAAAEAETAQLRNNVDKEIARHVSAQLDNFRKDYEVAKIKELSSLKEQLAAAEAKEEMLYLLREGQAAMRTNIQNLEAELEKYRAATTKSSHALGKIGEAELFEMLNAHVLPCFPYAEVRDMTTVKHVADFHLWVNGPTNKRTKILVDSKKYSSPVHNAEIEKLYSDVDADDDADAGLMVSLDSAIYTKSQFQIGKTKKGKPCMFMTFEKLDDGVRQEVLCWAVRVLVEVVAIKNKSSQDIMIADVQLFLGELDMSITDVENCLKACRILNDTLRDTKERLVTRVSTYRTRCGIVVEPAPAMNVITHTGDIPFRCYAINATGEQCKSRRVAKGLLCARHTTMKGAGKSVALVEGAMLTEGGDGGGGCESS